MIHSCFPSPAQAAAYAISLWLHRFPLALERRIAAFVAPSAFMAGQLIRWGIPVERIRAIPNFAPRPADASPEPGEYGLYLGRLATEKGVNVLVRALAVAGDPPFRFAGAGPAEDHMRRLVDELRLCNTKFLGHLDQASVAVVLRKARFVALPSLWRENAPLAALEAMAAGRPLLVSTIGGLPELIESGAGTGCAPGDVAGLAGRIGRLMRDDRRCRDAGMRALAYAESNLRPDLHLQRLEDLYGEAGLLATTSWEGC
jgi:glycosyltransferase involved in cell wall biosynthesis